MVRATLADLGLSDRGSVKVQYLFRLRRVATDGRDTLKVARGLSESPPGRQTRGYFLGVFRGAVEGRSARAGRRTALLLCFLMLLGVPAARAESLVPLGEVRASSTLGAEQSTSLQSRSRFGYALNPGMPSVSELTSTSSSVLATWDCTGTPCPWGDHTSALVAVWPVSAEPTRSRYGYTLSDYVYARAWNVAGWRVTVGSGRAVVYGGPLQGPHVALASLGTGESFTIPAGLSADEVLSVQSDIAFDYSLTPGTSSPPAPSTVDCTDPIHCDRVSWVASRWRYDGPRADPGDWIGGVVAWPSWSAYSSNGRSGWDSRTVYSASGEKLYPYMGRWAQGCKIRVVSGSILVIEWERGRNAWRETNISMGDSYTVHLIGRENSAMIETPNNSRPFQVSLSRCTPRRIVKSSSE